MFAASTVAAAAVRSGGRGAGVAGASTRPARRTNAISGIQLPPERADMPLWSLTPDYSEPEDCCDCQMIRLKKHVNSKKADGKGNAESLLGYSTVIKISSASRLRWLAGSGMGRRAWAVRREPLRAAGRLVTPRKSFIHLDDLLDGRRAPLAPVRTRHGHRPASPDSSPRATSTKLDDRRSGATPDHCISTVAPICGAQMILPCSKSTARVCGSAPTRSCSSETARPSRLSQAARIAPTTM